MNEREINSLFVGFVFGILFIFGIMLCLGEFSLIKISHQTADDICKQITNNNYAKGIQDKEHIWNRKLICEIPSYDSTRNIIIKQNNENN